MERGLCPHETGVHWGRELGTARGALPWRMLTGLGQYCFVRTFSVANDKILAQVDLSKPETLID
jgi:hypothetical protein